jgi:hypothetical protein
MLCGFGVGFAVGLVCDWIVAQETSRLEAAVEEDTKAIEENALGRSALEGVEVLDEEALGVVEESAGRRASTAFPEDSAQQEEKSAA